LRAGRGHLVAGVTVIYAHSTDAAERGRRHHAGDLPGRDGRDRRGAPGHLQVRRS